MNGSTLNGATLNGGAGSIQQIQIGTAPAFVWQAMVTLGGVDVTALLIGAVTVDREEGAAGVADFALHYPPGADVPADITDRAVTIDLISIASGETTQTRLFTGVAAEPVWNALSRTMAVTCTDNLQQRVEALSVDAVDALVEGQWSLDVFDPLDGRSRWDYAVERLQSRQASLDCSPHGNLRVTSWYSEQQPHVLFGAGTTLYESIGVELAQLSSVTNRVELEIAYRYSRFRERRQQYSWIHPNTGGLGGLGGFCAWRSDDTELPTTEMVIDAAKDGGLTPVAASYYRLPPSMGNPCGDGSPWINSFDNLLLGASWTGATRWVQTVTETYSLTLATAAGTIEGQQVIARDGTSFEVEAPEGWEESLTSIDPDATDDEVAGDESPELGDPGDRDDEPRRLAALHLQLAMAHTTLIAAHRQTRVTWSAPTPMVLGIDLIHTLEIDDQYIRARGKCSRRVDKLDFDSGECITDLTISVMRGGGESDPLIIPARPGVLPAEPEQNPAREVISDTLPTQLGGKLASPAYDEAKPGFSGNYTNVEDLTLETFPRRLDGQVAEIPAADRDEYTATAAQLYRVGIPNDLLEL
nr:hypothetical protein [Pseudomonas aromaticivorans]